MFAAAIDDNVITVYETDPETGIAVDVFDRIAIDPDIEYTEINLRVYRDRIEAVEAWKIDHDAGIAVCVWYHLF